MFEYCCVVGENFSLCCRWEFFVVVLLGMNVFFKCWAIELVSERCIVSLLDRVVEVKPTYILLLLLLSEIQSPRGHLNLYITLVFCSTPILTDNTTILEHQNNKQKLQILEALYIRNLQSALNRINFQTSANVLKCL